MIKLVNLYRKVRWSTSMNDALNTSTGPSVPTLGGDFARTGVNPGPGPAGIPRLQWRIQTGGEILASPVTKRVSSAMAGIEAL